MTLRCPECGTDFENTRELLHVCNLCDKTADRRSAQLFSIPPNKTILVCKDCLPKLNDKPLLTLLEEREVASGTLA